MHIPVAALDIGYGFAKIAHNTEKEPNTTKTLCFSSQAPTTLKEFQPSTALDKSNVITVDIKGNLYVVGPDVGLHQKLHSIHILGNNYVHSEQYLALNLAAIVYTGATNISTLMVGLPVDLFDSKKDFLINLLEGEHRINSKHTVTVGSVVPVSQPVGGLYHAHATRHLNIQMDKDYLIIDPGYYTFDWIVMKGLKRNEYLSGHHPGGMNGVLSSIAKSINNEYGKDYRDLNIIDTALRTNDFKIQDQSIPLDKHIKAGEAEMAEAIQVMNNHIGDTRSFEHTLLVGGPSNYYYPTIQKLLPFRKVSQIENPMFANVRGFYEIGLSFEKDKGNNAA